MLDIFGSKWEKDLIRQANLTFKGNFIEVENYLNGKTNNYINETMP